MAVTLEQIKGMLDELGLRYIADEEKIGKNEIALYMKTEHYRDKDGDNALLIIIKLLEDGEYIEIFAPSAFKIKGKNVDAFLKAAAMIQWKTKLIQFEYDDTDGEVRPVVEFPIEDGTITTKQLGRCVHGLAELVDRYYPVLDKALKEGVIDFDDEMKALLGELINMLQELRDEYTGNSGKKDSEDDDDDGITSL